MLSSPFIKNPTDHISFSLPVIGMALKHMLFQSIALLLLPVFLWSGISGLALLTGAELGSMPFSKPVVDNGGESPYRPRLLFGPSDVAGLQAKLGSSSFTGGEIGNALSATIKGQRSNSAIAFALANVNNANKGQNDYGKVVGQKATAYDNYQILIIYDLQSKYMTSAERTALRSKLLSSARNWYKDAMQSSEWYYQRHQMCNWVYHYFGHKIQNILYSGIIFRDDPDAAQWRARGSELLSWVIEDWPSNGVWDMQQKKWKTKPTTVELVDESAGSPNEYGIRSSYNLAELMYVAERNLSWNTWRSDTMMNGLWRSEGKFWTYNLSWRVAKDFKQGYRDSYASYGGAAGHGTARDLGIDENEALLYWGWRLNDPVLAWHYYANPSGLYDDIPMGDLLDDWNKKRGSYKSFLQFLAWGEVKPQSPQAAGWALDALWPQVGIGIMRLSWAKNRAVIARQGFTSGATGKVWFQCGQGGSKIRSSHGGVLFEADSYDVLAAGSYNGSGGDASEFLKFDPHTQNTLFIDDQGQDVPQVLPQQRQRHGSTKKIATDTYLMDASTPTATQLNTDGWRDLWKNKSYGVNWTREVHLQRNADINKVVLAIHDRASTFDRGTGKQRSDQHEFRFNFINANVQARAGSKNIYDLGNGWVLVGKSANQISGSVRTYQKASGNDIPVDMPFKAAWVGVNGSTVDIRWAIAKSVATAQAYLDGTTPSANKPPQIKNISVSGELLAPANLAVNAAITDSDGTISAVNLSVNGQAAHEEHLSPWDWSSTVDAPLQQMPAGTYTLKIVAVDNDGASSTSTQTITIRDPTPSNQAPKIEQITVSGELLAPADLAVNATITDSDGTISAASLLVNGQAAHEEHLSPWDWSSSVDAPLKQLPAGTYTLKIVAVDNEGASTSSSKTITVKSAANNDLQIRVGAENKTFSGDAITSYSKTQDRGTATIVATGHGLQLTGNAWKSIPLNYAVTKNTCIAFDLAVTNAGELLGIGFDNDNDHSNNLFGKASMFVLAGSQATPTNINDVRNLRANSVVIPVGTYYTGSVNRLCLMGDDDGHASTNATFSNIRIYEQNSNPPQPPQNIVSNLSISTGKQYEWFDAAVNQKTYIDRDYKITGLPSILQNATALRTANNDKQSNAAQKLISFRVNQDAAVYIAYDNGNTTLENKWCNNAGGWQTQSIVITTSLAGDDARLVRRKLFKAGSTVTLNGNGGTSNTCSMYYVMVLPTALDSPLTNN